MSYNEREAASFLTHAQEVALRALQAGRISRAVYNDKMVYAKRNAAKIRDGFYDAHARRAGA